MDTTKLRSKMEDLTPQNAASLLQDIFDLYDEFGNTQHLDGDLRWCRQSVFSVNEIVKSPSSDEFVTALNEIENPPVKMIDGHPMPQPYSLSLNNLLESFMCQTCKRGLDVFKAVREITDKRIGEDVNIGHRYAVVEAASKTTLTADTASTLPEIGMVILRMAWKIREINYAIPSQIDTAMKLIMRGLKDTLIGRKFYAPHIRYTMEYAFIKFSEKTPDYRYYTPYQYFWNYLHDLADTFCDCNQSNRNFVGVYLYKNQNHLTHEYRAVYEKLNADAGYEPPPCIRAKVWREYMKSAFFGVFQLSEYITGDSERTLNAAIDIYNNYFGEGENR